MTETDDVAVAVPASPASMTFADFGEAFLRKVVHRRRVLEVVERVLGEKIELGPIGAGPGRKFARVHATGWFQPMSGVEIPGPDIAFRVIIPVDVDFAIEIARDVNRFRARLLVPVTVKLRLEPPLDLMVDVVLPEEDEVSLQVETDKRRSAVLQRVAGLETELRRFMMRVMEKEFAKPHIQRIMRIDLLQLVDDSWPHLVDRLLPDDPPPHHDPGAEAPADLL
ncbi:hypothetical protein GCM10011584_27480 [Nocardioides phosphati]|uniref:Uncharacterized protein n=1 Tax=Nocardioides phosphati TaxID=1867775 RepID=A0ABQ2NBX0_9ACTN|nr:hypothetical protein [Nocardioides phosphati]GGO92022.1 hypothetical protein GCM10011584_27480 [Nocardioides phosphati]